MYWQRWYVWEISHNKTPFQSYITKGCKYLKEILRLKKTIPCHTFHISLIDISNGLLDM